MRNLALKDSILYVFGCVWTRTFDATRLRNLFLNVQVRMFSVAFGSPLLDAIHPRNVALNG